MTCPNCGTEFTPKTKCQRFCRYECSDQYRYKKARWFEREWAAWKRDFAAKRNQPTAEAPI